mgnify:CR=1 FL=1
MSHKLPTKQQILECPYGVSCYYYSLKDGTDTGIKFFENKRECEQSKYYQHIASLSGLSPRCWGSVYSNGFFGYFTEEIEMLHKLYNLKNLPRKIKKEIENLAKELEETCDIQVDWNYRNFGINKFGELMYVDFGDIPQYRYVNR